MKLRKLFTLVAVLAGVLAIATGCSNASSKDKRDATQALATLTGSVKDLYADDSYQMPVRGLNAALVDRVAAKAAPVKAKQNALSGSQQQEFNQAQSHLQAARNIVTVNTQLDDAFGKDGLVTPTYDATPLTQAYAALKDSNPKYAKTLRLEVATVTKERKAIKAVQRLYAEKISLHGITAKVRPKVTKKQLVAATKAITAIDYDKFQETYLPYVAKAQKAYDKKHPQHKADAADAAAAASTESSAASSSSKANASSSSSKAKTSSSTAQNPLAGLYGGHTPYTVAQSYIANSPNNKPIPGIGSTKVPQKTPAKTAGTTSSKPATSTSKATHSTTSSKTTSAAHSSTAATKPAGSTASSSATKESESATKTSTDKDAGSTKAPADTTKTSTPAKDSSK